MRLFVKKSNFIWTDWEIVPIFINPEFTFKYFFVTKISKLKY